MYISRHAMKGESHDPSARNQSCSNCDRKVLYLVWVNDQLGYITAHHGTHTTGFCRSEWVDRYPFSIDTDCRKSCKSICPTDLFYYGTLSMALPGHYLYAILSRH